MSTELGSSGDEITVPAVLLSLAGQIFAIILMEDASTATFEQKSSIIDPPAALVLVPPMLQD